MEADAAASRQDHARDGGDKGRPRSSTTAAVARSRRESEAPQGRRSDRALSERWGSQGGRIRRRCVLRQQRVEGDRSHDAGVEAGVEADGGAAPAGRQNRNVEPRPSRVLGEVVVGDENRLVGDSQRRVVDNAALGSQGQMHVGAGLGVALLQLGQAGVEFIHRRGRG